MVVVVKLSESGKLCLPMANYIFYNEKQFKNNNFELVDFEPICRRTEVKENNCLNWWSWWHKNYLTSAENTFKFKNIKTLRQKKIWRLVWKMHILSIIMFRSDDANPNETRNVLRTPSKPLLKWSKIPVQQLPRPVFFVPNRSFKTIKSKILKWKLLPSHDPNKMGSNWKFYEL